LNHLDALAITTAQLHGLGNEATIHFQKHDGLVAHGLNGITGHRHGHVGLR